MKRYRYVAEFLSTPWALMPERISAGASILSRWAEGRPASVSTQQEIENDRQARDSRRADSLRAGGGAIAVLQLYGVITQRGNMMDDISGPGTCSAQVFSEGLRSALSDDTIGAILIDIDSPGGSVYGTAELAAELYSARGQKPICAIANSLAASAAYWIGCSASEFYVTPGGEVGSIGVWQAHMDHSEEFAQEGIKTTLIAAGKYKTEGNPYGPLDEEAQSFMQSRVDDYYASFTRSVARGRGVPIEKVRNGMGQGRCIGADAALAEKMVDGILTFDALIAQMQRQLKASRQLMPVQKSRRAAAERTLQILG